MEYKYVIIGAGNGGQSLAGDMVLRGTKVSAIYDKNPAPIRDIQAAGGIKMSGPVVQGFAPIDHPTESLEDAMQQGNVFLVTIVGNFHPDLAREMAPFVRESDIILLIPGNAGSSLLFRKTLEEAGVTKMPLIGETISMPYATRLLGPAHAGIKARKLNLRAPRQPQRRAVCRRQPCNSRDLALERLAQRRHEQHQPLRSCSVLSVQHRQGRVPERR